MEIITRKIPKVKNNLEIIKVKGKGHPDVICDDVANNVSETLSLNYIRDYGEIQPHCIQYVNTTGGKVEVNYGDYDLDECPGMLIKGCASPLSHDPTELSIDSVTSYFIDNATSPLIDVDVFCHFGNTTRSSYDYMGWGYSTDSVFEKTMSYISEQILVFDERIGTDFELTGIKKGKQILINVEYAVLCAEFENEFELQYLDTDLTNFIKEIISSNVTTKSILTATGTRFESVSGTLGRSNRENGLITPLRTNGYYYDAPNILKLKYNELAFEIAKQIRSETDIPEVDIVVLSNPDVVHINSVNAKKEDIANAENIAKEVYADIMEEKHEETVTI